MEDWPLSVPEDLARHRDEPGSDAALDERVCDYLRPSRVREAFQAAAGASHGSGGEPARYLFRCLSRSYLERCSVEQDRELGELSRRHPPPETGYETLLATESDHVLAALSRQHRSRIAWKCFLFE